VEWRSNLPARCPLSVAQLLVCCLSVLSTRLACPLFRLRVRPVLLLRWFRDRRRRRKVTFSPAPTVVSFWAQDAPAALGRPMLHSGRFPQPGQLILKGAAISALVQFEHGDASPAEDHPISARHDCHEAREADDARPWQVVKHKHWWRHDRSFKAARHARRYGLVAFKEKAKGMCYNCLSKNHFKKNCREPKRCWKRWSYFCLLP
jgi:hypothetical protein